MKLFNYTKWEVLETYSNSGTQYCIQVRMNNRTGFKHFKVTRVAGLSGWCDAKLDINKINELTINPK